MNSSPTVELSRIRPAYEQVALQLRGRILDGSMKPGDRLPVEGQLSSTLGVSRTTIREALRMLSSQDLVHTVRGVNGGTFVSTIDAKGFIDNMESRLGLMASNDVISTQELLEVRSLIEVPSARLAAVRRTAEDLDVLRVAAKGNVNSGTRDLRGQHSRDFHMSVVKAAHNVLLTSIAQPIFTVWAQTGLATSNVWSDIDDEHFALIDCLERHDADGAGQITLLHLEKMRNSVDKEAAAQSLE